MIAKYANQRFLTVRNANSIAAKDYDTLAALNRNSLKLYEEICYSDWAEHGNRIAFSSYDFMKRTGIDESDIRKAWNILESVGIINKYPNSTNEYWIQINVPDRNSLSNINKSTLIKGRNKMSVITHTKSDCKLSDFSDSGKFLVSKFMQGDCEFSTVNFAEEYKITQRSAERAAKELKEKGFLIQINESWHFCAIPYKKIEKPFWYNCTDEEWIIKDMEWHINWCDNPKSEEQVFDDDKIDYTIKENSLINRAKRISVENNEPDRNSPNNI